MHSGWPLLTHTDLYQFLAVASPACWLRTKRFNCQPNIALDKVPFVADDSPRKKWKNSYTFFSFVFQFFPAQNHLSTEDHGQCHLAFMDQFGVSRYHQGETDFEIAIESTIPTDHWDRWLQPLPFNKSSFFKGYVGFVPIFHAFFELGCIISVCLIRFFFSVKREVKSSTVPTWTANTMLLSLSSTLLTLTWEPLRVRLVGFSRLKPPKNYCTNEWIDKWINEEASK